MDCAERGPSGIPKGLRSGESASLGRDEARRESKAVKRRQFSEGDTIMASDHVVSQELKSLQEELSAAQRERCAAASAGQPSSSSNPAPESADEHEWRDQISELANAVTSFLEEAEKDIAAHPAQSVIGALVVGILIGWLVGRR